MDHEVFASAILDRKDIDLLDVANAMRSGGGFMSRLADALVVADDSNARGILATWALDIQAFYTIPTKTYTLDVTISTVAVSTEDAYIKASAEMFAFYSDVVEVESVSDAMEEE